jgi:hypothetical protein
MVSFEAGPLSGQSKLEKSLPNKPEISNEIGILRYETLLLY